jgi:hypothetical protein
MNVPMKALRAFPYAGRDISKGQEFNARSVIDADVLVGLRHAERRTQTYQTRVLTAAPPAFNRGADIDSMDAAALRALAERMGIKVHHRAGADKLRQALRERART